MSDCPPISQNPDVDGVGVRVALYVQTFLAILTFYVSPFDSLDALTATVITSIALQVTAIVAAKTLTLYHALLVTWLTFPAFFFTLAYEIFFGLVGTTRYELFIGVRICTMVFSAFTVWVWITAPTFGPTPQCNSTVVIAVFARAHPSGALRVIAIAIAATFGLISAVLSLILLRNVSARTRAAWIRFRDPARTLKRRIAHALGFAPATLTVLVVVACTAVPMLLLGLAIANAELTIRWNNIAPSDGAPWSYGQIIALILVAAPLVSLRRAIRDTMARGNDTPLEHRPFAYVFGLFVRRYFPKRFAQQFSHLVPEELPPSGTSAAVSTDSDGYKVGPIS